MKKLLVFVVALLFVQNLFGQKEINIATKFPCPDCQKFDVNINNLQSIEENSLQQIFKEIVSTSEIEFDFPQAACQQRTQYLSMLLAKKYKLQHFRVWLFSPMNLDRNGKDFLLIDDKNGLANGKISWAYHVAPAIKVSNKVVVIDPSLDNTKPLPIKDWLNLIGNSDKSEYAFLNSDFYFFNRANDCYQNFQDACPLRGDFYKYEGNAWDNLLVEKGLALNDVAMNIYRKYIFALKNSNNKEDQEAFEYLRKIFGNYENLEELLAKNPEKDQSRVFYNKYGDMFSKYSHITIEARNFYVNRTNFWVKKVNELSKMP